MLLGSLVPHWDSHEHKANRPPSFLLPSPLSRVPETPSSPVNYITGESDAPSVDELAPKPTLRGPPISGSPSGYFSPGGESSSSVFSPQQDNQSIYSAATSPPETANGHLSPRNYSTFGNEGWPDRSSSSDTGHRRTRSRGRNPFSLSNISDSLRHGSKRREREN